MRNLIFAINITLDGCCDRTKVIGDDETLEYFANLMRDDVDLQIFGRKTYQVDGPFLAGSRKKPSYVKSRARICSDIRLRQQNCFFAIIGQR